jgi:hypothetical protein
VGVGGVCPNVVSREVDAVGSFDDLFARRVSELVSDTMIARRLSTKTMLAGMHAFLMALEESGPADTFEVAVLGTLAFVESGVRTRLQFSLGSSMRSTTMTWTGSVVASSLSPS